MSIETAFLQADKAFTYGHMITYFVSRNVVDGMAAGDFKSINSAANSLFEGGHVQNIEIGESKHYIYIKCNCLPEMRKDRVYKILLSLHNSSYDIAFLQADKAFTYGHMITYFVSRNVVDGMAAGDFKSINSAANSLFEGGHVQNIEIGESKHYIYIKCNCLPEMRKDRVYKILLSLHNSSYDIANACCGCPAGKGPVTPKSVPPKVGPAGPILAEKFAKIGPPDHFCCQNRSGRTDFCGGPIFSLQANS